MATAIERPGTDEFDSYYGGYIGRVPEGDVLALLERQIAEVEGALGGLSDEQALFRFAPGEWTIKEVVGHLVDAERLFSYRVLCFARNESAPLNSFDPDDYVREADYNARTLADLLEEWALLRRANLIAWRFLTPEASQRRGTASGLVLSARALIYITAGHIIYHQEDLSEKYLPGLG